MSTTAQIRAEMVLMYKAPAELENEDQARSYLSVVFASLDRMKPNPDEAEHIWEAFKREWRFKTWPTPAELCSRLTKFRSTQASLGKATGRREHNPDGASPQIDHRPYRHGEFLAAVDLARRNAAENHPRWGGLDRALVRCGEALIRNRDDQDRPCYEDAAE
jgi:hypothetical protein